MTVQQHTFAVIALFLAWNSTSALAGACDPLQILIQDSYSSISDQQRKLVKDNSKDVDTHSSESSSGAFSYFDVLKASGGQSLDFSNSLREKFHLDFNSSDRKWETYTLLSDNAKEAYIGCLKSQDQNIFLLPSNNAMTSPEMSVTVKLHPFVVYSKIKASFAATNASILDRQREWTLAPGGSVIISLRRDLDKSMSFKAIVGDGSEEISLPPRQNFKFQREIRYSKEETRYGHACDECHDTHQICVVLENDDDAVIVPQTARFVDVIHKENGAAACSLSDISGWRAGVLYPLAVVAAIPARRISTCSGRLVGAAAGGRTMVMSPPAATSF